MLTLLAASDFIRFHAIRVSTSPPLLRDKFDFVLMEPKELMGHVTAGAIAGAAVELALYPLDTIKTRLQAARGGSRVNFKHLYKGVGGNLLGAVPACAVFFAVYEPVKVMLMPDLGGSQPIGVHLLAATTGGLAASMIRVPTEVIKSRMQTGQFPSARLAAKYIATHEGILAGLFAGFGSSLLRDLPFDAIEFTSYERFKMFWKSSHGGNEPQKHETVAIGALAGMLTGAITTPLDVVKTRLMIQGGRTVVHSIDSLNSCSSQRYRGIIDCFVRTAREEGWSALFKGMSPRVAFIGLGGGIFFCALETAKDIFLLKRIAT